MIEVKRADVFWNYGATFIRMASALIILPLMLELLPREEVGLWMVMLELYTMINLFDFGFNPTFSRAVTYIFSGAKSLQKQGFIPVEEVNQDRISYPLLKNVLGAMRRYYGFVSLALLLLLGTLGVWYVERLLTDYSEDILMAKIAWFSYGFLLCYQFFTFYYDALLVGRGMIRRSRQIIVFSQILHVVIASTLLLSGFGIISMVVGQFVSITTNRFLAKSSFYDREVRSGLREVKEPPAWRNTLQTLFSTAWKSGVSALSMEMMRGVLPLIGALYIPLTTMGEYGLSKRIVSLTFSLGAVWFSTYYPRLTSKQIKMAMPEVKRIYIKALIIAVATYILAATLVISFGDSLLIYLKSEVYLLPSLILLIMFVSSLFDVITYLSTSVLLSRNEVPHYMAQAVTALFTIVLLFTGFRYFNMGVVWLVILPCATQLCYHYWRWSYKVWKELKIRGKDLYLFK